MAKKKIKTKNIIQKNAGYIISNPEHSTANDNLQLLRITVTNLERRIARCNTRNHFCVGANSGGFGRADTRPRGRDVRAGVGGGDAPVVGTGSGAKQNRDASHRLPASGRASAR